VAGAAIADVSFGSKAKGCDWLLTADSVEKVALLFGLGQNYSIGQRENTQHDGTVIEWAGAAVLLVQH
jgi:hypothetical protein